MNLQRTIVQSLITDTSKTATYQSSTLTVPLLDDYTFWASVSNVSGTSPTLDINIQLTVDRGTTWFNVLRFARITAADTRKLICFPTPKGGAGASPVDLTKLEAAVADTDGNAVVSGFAPLTSKLRINNVISGTSPSFDISIYVIGNPRQMF